MANLIAAYPRAPLVFPGRANARGPRPPLIGPGGGINPAAPVTSYLNPGGSGDRTALITVTLGGALAAQLSSGTADNLVDGDFTASSAGSAGIGAGTASFADGDYFGLAYPARVFIDRVRLTMDRALAPAWGAWKFAWWDGAAARDLNGFTWDQQVQEQDVAGMPSGGTTELRIVKVGALAAVTAPFFEEIECRIAAGI
jgi:hypothetical protein